MIRSEFTANELLAAAPTYRYTVRKVTRKPAKPAATFTRVHALLTLGAILPAMLAAALYL